MAHAVLPPLDYALVDVFAENPLEGNMLAIFTDGRALTTEQMQALARAMNLPETTFILPADDPATELEQGVRVRIFTAQEELPFAGHPTLGTSSWLYWNHPLLRGAQSITLKLNAGPITVRFEHPQPGQAGVFGSMRQQDPTFGSIYDAETIARVLEMPVADIDPAYPIQTVSTGLPYCIVPLRSLEAIGRLTIPATSSRRWLAQSDAKFFYCTTPADPGSGADFHSRMQFYGGEDPATGSASGCAISYLVHHGIVPSGRTIVFEQGVEMLRPSRIHASALRENGARGSVDDGIITGVFVGGRTIPVASGRFFQR